MTHPYGYIRLTEGSDGDHVDCFIGPNEDATTAYIVQIRNPKTGAYDEDKCFLGFNSRTEARQAFDDNYTEPEKFFMKMFEMPMDKFKEHVLHKENQGRRIREL